MTVFDAAWYDIAMTEPGAPAMEPLESSPWLGVYEHLSALIDPNEEVVDLGCGTGRFIELLLREGHYGQITGIDWSELAILEARAYTTATWLDTAGTKPPPIRWQVQDLAAWQPDPTRAGSTVYVCSEVLEHLEDDRELVARIPPGHRLLFTVPNFDSESHLRVFRNVGDAFRRYDSWLEFRHWRLIGLERQAIHLYSARRRTTSW